jgi:hypothetical protein
MMKDEVDVPEMLPVELIVRLLEPNVAVPEVNVSAPFIVEIPANAKLEDVLFIRMEPVDETVVAPIESAFEPATEIIPLFVIVALGRVKVPPAKLVILPPLDMFMDNVAAFK